MLKSILVYNAKSGDQRIPNKIDYIIGRFQEKNILVQPYRVVPNKNQKLVEVIKENKYDFIIISGGDGSVNHMVNIMLKNDISVPLAIIPSGTCNDFARSVKIPNDLEKALDIILAGRIIAVDVGLINDTQYFVGTCAGGLFVDISFNTHTELKKNFGPFAYYLKALSEVSNIDSFKIKIKTDETEIEEKVFIFLILNGKDAAGFSNLIEEADVTDGLMDILLIKDCTHIDLANLFFKVLSNDFSNDKHVTKLSTRSCYLESDKNIHLSIDGEKGMDLPINVKFINKRLKVIVK